MDSLEAGNQEIIISEDTGGLEPFANFSFSIFKFSQVRILTTIQNRKSFFIPNFAP